MEIKNCMCKHNFHNFPGNEFVQRCLKFLVRMNCNIFNLQHNF